MANIAKCGNLAGWLLIAWAIGSCSGNGGTSGSTDTGATPTKESCSGLADTVEIYMLTAEQATAACRGYAKCDAQPLVDDPISAYCRSIAVVVTGLAGNVGYATDADAQAACQANYDACLSAPGSAANAAQLTTTMLNRACPPSTTACNATIGELDSCVAAIRAYGKTKGPTQCSEVTLSWLRNGTAPSGTAPVECSTMNDASCLQLATGVN